MCGGQRRREETLARLHVNINPIKYKHKCNCVCVHMCIRYNTHIINLNKPRKQWAGRKHLFGIKDLQFGAHKFREQPNCVPHGSKSQGVLKAKKGDLHYKEFSLELEAGSSVGWTCLTAKAITRGWKKFVVVTSHRCSYRVLEISVVGPVEKFKIPPGGDVCKVHPLNGLLAPLRKKNTLDISDSILFHISQGPSDMVSIYIFSFIILQHHPTHQR